MLQLGDELRLQRASFVTLARTPNISLCALISSFVYRNHSICIWVIVRMKGVSIHKYLDFWYIFGMVEMFTVSK